MFRTHRPSWMASLLLAVVVLAGCGGSGEGLVLFVDAEYDPAAVSNASATLSETTPSVAQTFTVTSDGKFEEFWLVITNGESTDDGIVRITVRPVDGMARPDPNPVTSIINPVDIDTSTLPTFPVEVFTEFFVGDDPGRQVMTGEQYAIVVEFVSRSGSTDTLPIARVLGRDDNGYGAGTMSTSSDGTSWTNSATDDLIFRTFVLR